MKKLLFSLLALPLLVSAADIYLAGDSTMCLRQKREYPMYGWGMSLEKLVKKGVKIHNHAEGGRSSKSFMTEKRWEKIMNSAKKGDFVIIQFGINDNAKGEKNRYRYTDPATTYRDYLRIYITEARAKGVIPVICTQTMICLFNKGGKAFRYNVVEKRVEAWRDVTQEMKCDFVDLNSYALEKFTALGKEKALKLHMFFEPGEFPNYPKGRKDTCHLREEGADFYAQAFVELAKKQNLAIAKLFK